MTKKFRRLPCLRHWTQLPRPSSSSRWSRYSPGKLTVSRFIVMPSTCPSLLVTTDSATTRPLSSYQVSHPMCLDTEELALRSAIYASLADSMVASVIEELSPKDERSKLLREKLAIIQETQVSAVSADFAAASNLQLLRRDALLKNFGFQPQVFFFLLCGRHRLKETMWWVPNQRSFKPCTYHQANWPDGWLVCDFCPEASRAQDQHESDVIQKDGF